MTKTAKKVSIGASEFALPAPRKGSIAVHSGLGRGPEVGQEIHIEVQNKRKKEFAAYQAEVSVSHEFPSAEYIFEVRGRMDGFLETDNQVKIEEIKSTFNIYDLMRALKEEPEHPYLLQLQTYGYFYWLQNKKIPELNLHLVSTRNRDTIDYNVKLELQDYETWFEIRMAELVEEVRAEEKRIERRKKTASTLAFPFPQPRTGQVELIDTITKGMQHNHPMLLQAPTGLGKTIGVLYPSLQESLARGQKVIYITPKNSQHAVAEEAIERMQDAGAKNLRSLTITAKSKMCFKNEVLCDPEYCEFAKDHYTKVAEHKVLEQLRKKKRLTTRSFKKIAEEFQVCPFEIQLDAAQDADTVICDYNYVFAPRTSFGRLSRSGLLPNGKPNLVIDEAHNLPSRAQDYYSSSLSVVSLEKMREDSQSLPKKFRRQAEELIDSCIKVIKMCGNPGATKPHAINPPYVELMMQDQELKAFLSNYLSSDVEIQPKDIVMRLSFYWSEFTQALEFMKSTSEENRGRFFTTFNPSPATIKITCCDASEMLKDTYDEYANVVAFSATLKPFDFYSQLSGLLSTDLQTAEFVSPFKKENRKVLVIPQISTKYSERDRNYPRIAEAIEKISSLKEGNYIAFFPSFDFMEKVLQKFQPNTNVVVLKQERYMTRAQSDEVLEQLKETESPKILFAVQGGVFSEGVDYPGRMVIGAFVVGPPLPNFDLEREKMREYYETHYSAGFDYAYTYPAMAKAVQAAGRVIRTESDKGIIILMDNRFIQNSYTKSMPQDWYDTNPQELVSQSILKDISDFWNLQT